MTNKRPRDYTKEKLWTTKEVADMLNRRERETLKEVGEWAAVNIPAYILEEHRVIVGLVKSLQRGEMPR